MLELLISPKRGEKRPWQLFFVGLLYASISFLIVYFLFSHDPVLSRYSGLLVSMFASLLAIVFVYFSMRLDEKENIRAKSEIKAIMHDWRILSMFVWLFLGFVVGFCIWQTLLPANVSFNSQIETYCVLKNPTHYSDCLDNFKINGLIEGIDTSPKGSFGGIFTNNISVLIVILIFSLIFGAGSIFIIAWNASIISTVISLSIKYNLSNLHIGLAKFMIHGIPEIAAYFMTAMAGGMASLALTAYIGKRLSRDNFLKIVFRTALLVLLAVVVLVLAAGLEIYISPLIASLI